MLIYLTEEEKKEKKVQVNVGQCIVDLPEKLEIKILTCHLI